MSAASDVEGPSAFSTTRTTLKRDETYDERSTLTLKESFFGVLFLFSYLFLNLFILWSYGQQVFTCFSRLFLTDETGNLPDGTYPNWNWFVCFFFRRKCGSMRPKWGPVTWLKSEELTGCDKHGSRRCGDTLRSRMSSSGRLSTDMMMMMNICSILDRIVT